MKKFSFKGISEFLTQRELKNILGGSENNNNSCSHTCPGCPTDTILCYGSC